MKKLLLLIILATASISFTSCSKDDVLPAIKTSTTSVQCSGMTQAGIRCKNMTTNSNGRCNLHGGN